MDRRLRLLCVGVLCLVTAAQVYAATDRWELYLQQSEVYRRRGAFGEAERTAIAAITEAEKSGLAHELVVSRNSLGVLYYELGRFADAERQFRRAMAVLD